jgi:hypothetical protein
VREGGGAGNKRKVRAGVEQEQGGGGIDYGQEAPGRKNVWGCGDRVQCWCSLKDAHVMRTHPGCCCA